MKIDRHSTIGTPPSRRNERRGSTKSNAFARALSTDSEAPPASTVSGGAALGPVDALLALQEVSEDPDGRNRGRRRGEELLDSLDELHYGLLAGSLSLGAIERLAAMVAAKRGQVDDPRLARVLDEIEVRAAVELAKLGR
ncbi:MAG: flagellar assembly protein FliX [Proteobacteria bacterium]|nr:flagellar assembly protein FliX [Pseudomonadota bacterium]